MTPRRYFRTATDRREPVTASPVLDDGRPLLTVEETLVYLKLKPSNDGQPRAVYRLVAAGMPHLKVGRMLRFVPAELDAWMRRDRVADSVGVDALRLVR